MTKIRYVLALLAFALVLFSPSAAQADPSAILGINGADCDIHIVTSHTSTITTATAYDVGPQCSVVHVERVVVATTLPAGSTSTTDTDSRNGWERVTASQYGGLQYALVTWSYIEGGVRECENVAIDASGIHRRPDGC